MVTQYKKSKGFTLIEMLVVIVIIGILATIVIVSVSGSRKKASSVKAKTTMNQLTTLFEQAASQGCKIVSIASAATTSATFICSSTGSDTTDVTYGTIEPPPTGFSYSITIGGTTVLATFDPGTGQSPWAASSITDKSINSDYSFQASGFTGGGTFTCASTGGCSCSTVGGCD